MTRGISCAILGICISVRFRVLALTSMLLFTVTAARSVKYGERKGHVTLDNRQMQ